MTGEEKAIKIIETRKDNTTRDIRLCRNVQGKWQFVNLDKFKICPCEFESRELALLDLMKYFSKCSKMEIIEL